MADPIVRNAADPQQVAAATTKEKLLRQREVNDICVLLNLQEGRRVLWRFLERAKVFESIWRSSAEIHYLAGAQDFGHFIMAEIVAASPNAFLQMMMENKAEAETPLKEEKEK